jgi:hypothetical protein
MGGVERWKSNGKEDEFDNEGPIMVPQQMIVSMIISYVKARFAVISYG